MGGLGPVSSFAGLKSSRDYTSRHGDPVRTQRRSYGGSNYVVHNYGGWGNGFMMGYLAGSSPWYWGMPFHPAFYYGRPYYAPGVGSEVNVYPGHFSFWRLLCGLFLLAVVTIIVLAILAALFGGSKRRGRAFRSSFD